MQLCRKGQINKAKSVPRWWLQTLRQSKLIALLPDRTRKNAREAEGLHLIELAFAFLLDEEEPKCFEDARDDVHW